MTDGPKAALPLHRRLRRRRVWDALADRGSALALGSVLVLVAAAYVLGVRGVLAPVAWQAGLGAGLAFVVLRALLGLFRRDDDPAVLREVLSAHFGDEIRIDPDVTRLARQAIEQRLQLAAARVAAPTALARAIDGLVPALDHRLDFIAVQARAAASRRGAARFQAGMAQMARQRLSEVTRIADAGDPDTAATARRAADGLSAQVAASGGVVAHAEDRLMALDHAVAELGTLVAQALLHVSKGDREALERLCRDLKAPG
jgi:hypothetical protein